MKDSELAFKHHPNIIRIHKSYFVNVSFVKRISHYDNKYVVTVMNIDDKLPVSKNKLKILKQELIKFSSSSS